MNTLAKVVKALPGHWTQGRFNRGDSRCSIGWIYAIGGIPGHLPGERLREQCEQVKLLDEIVSEQFPDRVADLQASHNATVAFNDHPETTEEDVVAVFEKAAVKWDERV